MTGNQAVQVTIIVACRNEIKHIRGFLNSILSQDMAGICWEAIIADGMSEDGTREVVEEYSFLHPQLRFIANPGRIVSTGLNRAIQAARGEIIIRMDAHTTYASDYCQRCFVELMRTGADNVGGPARTRAAGMRARAVAAAYHSKFSTGGAKFHDANYEGWVDTVAYGCWRKSTLDRMGGFDEALVRNQDDELNLRLTRAGGKIWQTPAIVSWYSPRPTLTSLFRQYFQYGFWKVAVIRKHRLPGSWRHVVPICFVLANLILVLAVLLTGALGWLQWFDVSAAIWLAILTMYAVACMTASVFAARRHGLVILPYLPVVFAVYHFSYGAGFLAGLRWYFSKSAPRFNTHTVFTQITR